MKKHHIFKLSRILKWTFLIAAILLPISDAGFWITNGYPFLENFTVLDFIPNIPGMKPLAELSHMTKFFGFLVTLLPEAFNMAALLLLAKLFQSFEKMDFFSRKNVQMMKKIGGCILLNQVFFPIYMAILSVTLTLGNPPGERVISVALGSKQISLLVVGLCILLVSWVMDEGRKLHEEHASTI
ncbi:MAG: hypothetical protein K1000chlam3_00060 [Chlamydiae bacterium]|nr:hypothetical protein [Chlamydiota bacterium]